MAPMRSDRRLRAMDPYGRRAMDYVRENCPRQYAAIGDPVSFFSDLGERMRAQVSEAADALAQAPAPPEATTPEGWAQRVGEANVAGLMTEERVFSEMVWTAFPSEVGDEDEEDWMPLLPDTSDLARAEAEDRHL